jgi:ferredoxin
VSTAISYLEKLEGLSTCDSCHQPMYHMHKSGPVEVKNHATFDVLEAEFEPQVNRDTIASIGKFVKDDPRSRRQLKATLSIDARDCIGCEVCVAHCDKGVLKMCDGKAVIDLTQLNKCDLDGECVEVCPTDVVNLTILPVAAPEPLPRTGTD